MRINRFRKSRSTRLSRPSRLHEKYYDYKFEFKLENEITKLGWNLGDVDESPKYKDTYIFDAEYYGTSFTPKVVFVIKDGIICEPEIISIDVPVGISYKEFTTDIKRFDKAIKDVCKLKIF